MRWISREDSVYLVLGSAAVSCGVGYPASPCPFKFEGRVTRLTCGACKHFVPPRHILAWCGLYDQQRVVCEKPKSACSTCPYKQERSAAADIDWKDPDAVRAYHAAWRAANPDKVTEKANAFALAHPDYMKSYYQQNKKRIIERINAARRIRRGREQGKEKV